MIQNNFFTKEAPALKPGTEDAQALKPVTKDAPAFEPVTAGGAPLPSIKEFPEKPAPGDADWTVSAKEFPEKPAPGISEWRTPSKSRRNNERNGTSAPIDCSNGYGALLGAGGNEGSGSGSGNARSKVTRGSTPSTANAGATVIVETTTITAPKVCPLRLFGILALICLGAASTHSSYSATTALLSSQWYDSSAMLAAPADAVGCVTPACQCEALKRVYLDLQISDIDTGFPLPRRRALGPGQEADCCKLSAVSCNHHGGIKKFKLRRSGTSTPSGVIPLEALKGLVELESLDLGKDSSSSISGTIPGSLAKVGNLRHLSLTSRRLSGTLPAELLGTGRFEELKVTGRISGTVPTSYCKSASPKYHGSEVSYVCSKSAVLKSGPPAKASMCQALVASPYNLQPGGGEKYLLEAASVLQGIPCAVTIGLFSRTQCRGDCIATLVTKLGVALDPAMVTVIEFPRGLAWRQEAHEETMRQSPYDFFFLLGNELMPQVHGLGRINLYMCQFPFDWARPQGEKKQAKLLTYNMVLLNSEYSKGWYTRANERTGALTRPCAPIPTVLYPPVQAIAGAVVPLYQRPLRIVMLGRVFNEVQQKGHMVAIKAFTRLQVAWLAAPPMQRPPLELYLVGAVMTGHERYAERVQKLGNATPGVHVLFDASRKRVLSILSASRVVWSLTGFKQNRDDLKRVAHRLSAVGPSQMCDPSAALPPDETSDMDEGVKSAKCPNPADTEHFGIAVTEAMSAGAIPVLLRMGGLAELVPSRRVGRLAEDASEIVTSTLEVLLQADEQLGAMSNASILASSRFTGGTFHRRFKAMLHKGHLPRFWAGLTRSVCADPIDLSGTRLANGSLSLRGQRKYSEYRRLRTRLIAAIVDTRVDYTIATAVKANLRHLRAQAQWRLRVVHGTENAQFVRDALADVRPVEFINLGVATMTEYDYNVLLKTPSFWRSMKADRCLIFQTDGLLLRPIPNEFLRFDWVGAPWRRDNDAYKGINEDKVAIPTLDRSVRVGNGGFSLRGVQAMERVCTEHAAESQPAEQEDVFFVRNLHRHGYNIADLESAATFALEVPIPEHAVNTSRLVAIHQAWSFVRPEVLAQLLQIICSECGQ